MDIIAKYFFIIIVTFSFIIHTRLKTDSEKKKILNYLIIFTRQKCLSVKALFISIFFIMQVTQNFVNDLHPWTTLLGVAAIGLCALDVAIRQGKGTHVFYYVYITYIHLKIYLSKHGYSYSNMVSSAHHFIKILWSAIMILFMLKFTNLHTKPKMSSSSLLYSFLGFFFLLFYQSTYDWILFLIIIYH